MEKKELSSWWILAGIAAIAFFAFAVVMEWKTQRESWREIFKTPPAKQSSVTVAPPEARGVTTTGWQKLPAKLRIPVRRPVAEK